MSVINNFLTPFGQDTVAIFTLESEVQLIEDARPIKLKTRETSTLVEHPREDGSKAIDHKIDNPIEVEIDFIPINGSYRDVYNSIDRLRINNVALRIQTRTNTFFDMYIESISVLSDPSIFGSVKINVKFKQEQLFSVDIQALPESEVENPADSDIIDSGTKQSSPVPEQDEGSIFFKATNGLFGG